MNYAEKLGKRVAIHLKKSGFKKQNLTWRKSNEDTTLVVNIQKSRWGDWAYVNMGVSIHAIRALPSPKEYQCDIRFRLESVCPAELRDRVQGDYRNLLSESPVSPTDEDADLVTMALSNNGLPVLERMATLSDLRRLHREGQAGSTDTAAQLSRQLDQQPVIVGN